MLTAGAPSSTGGGGGGQLDSYLTPSVTASTRAQVLATRRFVIPKGNFVDCTLETAINSELPGLATCVTAFDIFGADGKVVLIERGSKLVGESRGQVAQGMKRVFILWSEARTPTGVVVQLASPGTDELGPLRCHWYGGYALLGALRGGHHGVDHRWRRADRGGLAGANGIRGHREPPGVPADHGRGSAQHHQHPADHQHQSRNSYSGDRRSRRGFQVRL